MSLYLGDTPIADGLSTALLSGKADVDLSNVNASGTSLASGWSMPSSRYIDLTLGASGTTYTAPANGYFQVSGNVSQIFGYVQIYSEGVDYTFQGLAQGHWGRGFIPVKKGQSVVLIYSNFNFEQLNFVYAEGEN